MCVILKEDGGNTMYKYEILDGNGDAIVCGRKTYSSYDAVYDAAELARHRKCGVRGYGMIRIIEIEVK